MLGRERGSLAVYVQAGVLHGIKLGPSGVLDLAVDVVNGVDNLQGRNIRIHQDLNTDEG